MFKVGLKASKDSIASEISDMYKVDVLKVKTSITPGKPKRVGKTQTFIKTGKWKKAIVTLKAGQKIESIEKK